MAGHRRVVTELGRIWRWSLLMAVAASIFSLMFGLLIQTVFYEVASNIPPVIRQDAHIGLPLCRYFPRLYGCDPWVGALSGLEIFELSLKVGQISGLLLNPILVAVLSAWVTIRLDSDPVVAGLATGVAGMFTTLVLALAFDVSLNLSSLNGIIGMLLLILLPVSGLIGERIGLVRLARRQPRRTTSFVLMDEAGKPDWTGESLSQRELEVLALVAEGFKNREIALQLFISNATVKTHLLHIFVKLGVENRTAAVTKALAYGLLRQEEKDAEPSD